MSVFDSNILLVVDDDQGMRTLVAEVGKRNGYVVFTADSGDALKQILSEQQPSLITLDLQMADMDGVEALRHLANNSCAAEVILLSGMDHKVLATARQFGLSLGLNMREPMQKPVRVHDLEKNLLRHKGECAPVTASEFRQALVEYELTVCYQPILQRTKQGMSINSVEALVRWQHPVRGWLYPGQFLPMVERENLITELTDFVLTESLRQVGHWHACGLQLGLAVNLAARTVGDLNFPDRLSRVMQEYSVLPEFLCFEVTEAAALGDLQVVMDSFARLRVKGVQLALDDFGIGTSSLTQLYKMPYSCMKIDRALIAEMSSSKQAQTVVSALIDLGHKLSLQVCAEGIESEATLNQLDKMGCDQFQGNYLSQPLSAVDAEQFVRRWVATQQADAGLLAG
ncbi:MAG: EAL domain-containing protein [Steroidobacteraceae bacterium]